MEKSTQNRVMKIPVSLRVSFKADLASDQTFLMSRAAKGLLRKGRKIAAL
jgi:hypothetical protein